MNYNTKKNKSIRRVARRQTKKEISSISRKKPSETASTEILASSNLGATSLSEPIEPPIDIPFVSRDESFSAYAVSLPDEIINDSYQECIFPNFQGNAQPADIQETRGFKEDLAEWAVEVNISHVGLNKLLKVLNSHFPDENLPRDARTLLRQRKLRSAVSTLYSGFYFCFGIKESLNILFQNNDIVLTEPIKISIAANIDGLSLSDSTDSVIWPILCSVTSIPSLKNVVFVVTIFHGLKKPDDANSLLKDFVNESIDLINNGVEIQNFVNEFSIEMIVCDLPAKSYVLKTKGHTGRYACFRCVQEGEGIRSTIYFTRTDCVLRTDSSFRLKSNPEHHVGSSILEEIPEFDIIQNVPIDYMHLVCLGVVKRLLAHKIYGWIMGKPPFKLRASHQIQISSRLLLLKRFIPSEFSRKTRKITDCKRYKATEFRTFLLYTGPVVLKEILSKRQYDNFMTLSVAISVLMRDVVKEQEWLDYAQSLIIVFLEESKKMYGTGFCSLNVHSLTHLVDCCRKFGKLDNFSSFSFENFMKEFRKKVRSAHKPLQQIVARFKEGFGLSSKRSPKVYPQYSQVHSEGPLLNNCTNPQYKKVCLKEFELSCNSFCNRFVELSNGVVFEILNFCHKPESTELVIVGFLYRNVGNLFEKPCLSSDIGINIIEKHHDELTCAKFRHITNKLVVLKYNEHENLYVSFPLLHNI